MMAPPVSGRVEIGSIRAEWLLGEKASGGRIGAGAAAAAQCLIAALAALALERIGVPQLLEHRRVVPDVLEVMLPRVAGADRQVAARIHVAFVGDEAHRGTGQAAAGHADRCCPCPPPCSSDGAALARVPGAMNVPLMSPLRRSLSRRWARIR